LRVDLDAEEIIETEEIKSLLKLIFIIYFLKESKYTKNKFLKISGKLVIHLKI
jgi:hypothetical protein